MSEFLLKTPDNLDYYVDKVKKKYDSINYNPSMYNDEIIMIDAELYFLGNLKLHLLKQNNDWSLPFIDEIKKKKFNLMERKFAIWNDLM